MKDAAGMIVIVLVIVALVVALLSHYRLYTTCPFCGGAGCRQCDFSGYVRRQQ